MKYFPLPRRLAVGILACAAATGSGALTLGRVQGVALIGRPLEVTVPVLFEASGETVPECADAQVFYGDTRLPEGRITTQVEAAGAGATVRVRASAAINEPVVTVYLNVGCRNRSTRRIVLLSEQPDPRSEATGRPVPLAQAVTEEPRAPTAPAARPPRAARPAAPQAGTESGSAASGQVATAPAPRPPRSPRVARPAAGREASATAQPRLRLEPLDLSAPPGDPSLRMSTMMAAPSEAAAEQRALAGAMWRALNARPEDLMREVQRLEALEKDLRSLRVSIQRNEQALADVRGQLQKAESQRYANPLVYGLALLALAAALLAAWAWRRRGTAAAAGSSPWWRPAAEDSRDSEAPMSRPGASGVTRLSAPAPLRDTGEPAAAVVDRRAPKEEPPPSMPRPSQDFSPSMRGDDFRASNSSSLRALRAEELHDVQQEADFFISLGEFDRAIEVLRSHISMNPETSAVAWLDLMEIYHKLDRRHDYEWVRRQFQHNYNADVPEFDNYTDASAGLEDYQNAMTRIVALWPSRRVLDVIEESIFRGPSSDGSNAFTLQAYRDLLLLHHIGTEIVGTEEEGRTSSFFGDLGQPPNFDPSSFSATAISPLSALTGNDARHGPDSEIGLDINLDEPSPGEEMLIGAAQRDDDSTHLLDFDLPDMDLSTLKPKKTRE
jgi:tetratricopeptide (TPR) repeat protein